MRDRVDIAVIGGGAAGIAAARRIMRRPDVSVLVLEAKDRLGGRAHTATVRARGSDVPVDLGCAWLHSGLSNVWTDIAESDGFRVDRSPAPWDRDDAASGPGAEDRAARARAQELFWRRAVAVTESGADGPSSDLVPPESPWRGALDALSSFVSGAELDRVSVRDFGLYRPGEGDDWRVEEGYGRVVAHHGRAVPVAFDAAATAIDHSGAGEIRIETARGVILARAVIVTASTDVLASDAIRFRPALPDKRDAAALLPLGSVEKLWLGVEKPDLFPAEDYRVGRYDTGRTAAYHFRPFGRPVIECFVGGALARDVVRDGCIAALAFARDELRGHLGGDAARAVSSLHLTRWGQDPHVAGAYAYAVPGGSGARDRLARPVDGRLFFAGEATHPSRFTTAHGAYETGVWAAEAALEALAIRLSR